MHPIVREMCKTSSKQENIFAEENSIIHPTNENKKCHKAASPMQMWEKERCGERVRDI